MVEKASGHDLKILRTDNGGEFTLTKFEEYLKSEGIHHEYTIPKIREQNGVADRLNRTLVETVHSMLIDSKLPHKFWPEALSTATYLGNRSPTKVIEGMTSHEAWSKENHRRNTCMFSAAMRILMSRKTRDKSLIQKHRNAFFWVTEKNKRVLIV